MNSQLENVLIEVEKAVVGKREVIKKLIMALLADGHVLLDDVPGVGPKRKRAIMRRFGSLKRLRAASVEDIAQVPGVPAEVAQAVYDALRAWDEEAQTVAEKAR